MGNTTNPSAITAASPAHQQSSISLLKRKPVKRLVSSSASNHSITSTSTGSSQISNPNDSNKKNNDRSSSSSSSSSTYSQSIARKSNLKMTGPSSGPTLKGEIVYPQVQKGYPLMDTTGIGMGMGMVMVMGAELNDEALNTPKTPKTFQQSQEELFSKLEALAAAKNKLSSTDHSVQSRVSSSSVGTSLQLPNHGSNRLQKSVNNSTNNRSRMGLNGSSSTSSLRQDIRHVPTNPPFGS
ncbi:hypothetical protein BX616_011215, partial [Lobosporangium transversale]